MREDIEAIRSVMSRMPQVTLMNQAQLISTFVEIVSILRDQYKYSREGAVWGASTILQEIGANRRRQWIDQQKQQAREQKKEVIKKESPPTEKQIEFMKRLGIETQEGMTREQASQAIDAKLAEAKGE